MDRVLQPSAVEQPVCVSCGHPSCWLAPPDHLAARWFDGPTCPTCAWGKRSPDASFEERLTAHRRRQAEMAHLGMPSDVDWRQLIYPGRVFGPKWHAYEVEAFGILLGPFFQRALAGPAAWPWGWLPTMDGRAGGIVQLWLRRVRHAGIAPYVEARWHPDSGDDVSVRGLEQDRRKSNRLLALNGEDLLRFSDPRGREPGSGRYRTEAEFRADLDDAVRRLEADGVRYPGANLLADTIGMSRSGLFEMFKKWPAVPRPWRASPER